MQYGKASVCSVQTSIDWDNILHWDDNNSNQWTAHGYTAECRQ